MNYEEIIKEAQKLGVVVSLRTLKRHSSKNLLPEPKRTHGGRGVGYIVEFPETAIGDVVANTQLLQHREMTMAKLYSIRKKAIEEEERDGGGRYIFFKHLPRIFEGKEKASKIVDQSPESFWGKYTRLYLMERIAAIKGIPVFELAIIKFYVVFNPKKKEIQFTREVFKGELREDIPSNVLHKRVLRLDFKVAE